MPALSAEPAKFGSSAGRTSGVCDGEFGGRNVSPRRPRHTGGLFSGPIAAGVSAGYWTFPEGI